MKMAVILQICAITGGGPIDIHLLDEVTIDQGIQAIVDCRQRDGGHVFFRTQKQFGGGRMVSLLEKDAKNLLTLLCQADPPRG